MGSGPSMTPITQINPNSTPPRPKITSLRTTKNSQDNRNNAIPRTNNASPITTKSSQDIPIIAAPIPKVTSPRHTGNSQDIPNNETPRTNNASPITSRVVDLEDDPGKSSTTWIPAMDQLDLRPKKWRQDGYDAWDDKTVTVLKTAIKGYLTPLNAMDEIEIIMCGGASHGKSSIINNCVTALNGHYCQVANIGSGREQITKQYKEYQAFELEDGRVKKVPIVFVDTRGFSDSRKLGTPVAAIKACIMGKVANGEILDPKITDKEWSRRRPQKSKVSHIAFVADATAIPDKIPSHGEMSTIYKNLRDIRSFSMQENIPVAAFITKCDMLDPSVENDLSRLYFSEKIECKVKVFSLMIDIAENRVFPVVNYTNHNNASNGMMIQTLLALKECTMDIMGGLYCRRN